MKFSERMTESIAALTALLDGAGIAYRKDEPLSAHTTFRIGGGAAVGIFPTCGEEMRAALSAVRETGVPVFTVGGGSNLLAPDAGFCGAVLFTKEMNAVTVTEAEDGTALLTAGAGVSLSTLARTAQRGGLTGAEFLYGIPGTVGGAVVMNAGAYQGETGQILVSSQYIDADDPREIRSRALSEHDYGYRKSVYLASLREVVASAVFRLKKGDPAVIEETMQALVAKRKASQPLEYPSAGSFFKRPVGAYAGQLIEECGLKGYRIGGAEVSVKHAGFIVNRGGATEADVRALARYVRETVLRETGYLLESEVRTMGGEAP